VEEEENSGKD